MTITIQVSLFTNIFTVQLQPHQVRHKTELNKMIKLITKQQRGKKGVKKRMMFEILKKLCCWRVLGDLSKKCPQLARPQNLHFCPLQ